MTAREPGGCLPGLARHKQDRALDTQTLGTAKQASQGTAGDMAKEKKTRNEKKVHNCFVT